MKIFVGIGILVPILYKLTNSKTESDSNKAPINQTNIIVKPITAIPHKPMVIKIPIFKPPYRNCIITFNTNAGPIVINAFGTKAPKTVIVMKTLINAGYFNKCLFHRLTTSGLFVLQGGDPTYTGNGGPDFRFPDENLPKSGTNNYPKGTVAMANSGPNTNGSQFFIVYKDTTLSPDYTIWGKVVKGLDIVEYVGKSGTIDRTTDGYPKIKLAIETASFKEIKQLG